jgi:hypothetical protein
MALKAKARIFVSRSVIESSPLLDVLQTMLNQEDRLDAWLNSLDKDDLGLEQ